MHLYGLLYFAVSGNEFREFCFSSYIYEIASIFVRGLISIWFCWALHPSTRHKSILAFVFFEESGSRQSPCCLVCISYWYRNSKPENCECIICCRGVLRNISRMGAKTNGQHHPISNNSKVKTALDSIQYWLHKLLLLEIGNSIKTWVKMISILFWRKLVRFDIFMIEF